MGYWKVEIFTSISEGKIIDLIGHPSLIDELIFKIEDNIVMRSWFEHQRSRCLC